MNLEQLREERDVAAWGGSFRAPVVVRILRRISETPSGCWLWSGAKTRAGYSSVRAAGGVTTSAHAALYRALVGEVPSGLELDHLCKTPLCVRPDHLEPVTGRVNTLRGDGPTARLARRTHCQSGHELVSGNLVPRKLPHRYCLTCQRSYQRAYKRALRARTTTTTTTAA